MNPDVPKTWTYRQTNEGTELKLFSASSESGADHTLRIDQRGVGRRWFELDEQAVFALAQAITEFEKGDAGEFQLNQELSLKSEPPSFVLSNCEVSYTFLAFEQLRMLYERIQEARLMAQIFG